jgi:hypothetical protein
MALIRVYFAQPAILISLIATAVAFYRVSLAKQSIAFLASLGFARAANIDLALVTDSRARRARKVKVTTHVALNDCIPASAYRRNDLLVEDVVVEHVIEIAVYRLDLALELKEDRHVNSCCAKDLVFGVQAIYRIALRRLELLLLFDGLEIPLQLFNFFLVPLLTSSLDSSRGFKLQLLVIIIDDLDFLLEACL